MALVHTLTTKIGLKLENPPGVQPHLWMDNLDAITARAFSLGGLGVINSDNRLHTIDLLMIRRVQSTFIDFPQDAETRVLDWALVHRLISPELVMLALGQPGVVSLQIIRDALITLTAHVDRLIAEEARYGAQS